MGQKTVRFSDLSGQLLRDGDNPVRLVVLEHPDLDDGPVQLEGLPAEVRPINDAALTVAVVDFYQGDSSEPRRVVMDVADFNALATDLPMAELLKNAERVRLSRGAVKAAPGGERIDYATAEHAGKPHRGKVTAEEARLVREHLDEVNARLSAAGVRQIDPANPEHVARYGLVSAGAAGVSVSLS